jgi:SNF2 family DNA or RNA helicase
VVSQFTSLLSIFQPLLTDAGFNWTRLDGSMSIRDRLAVIEDFQSTKPDTPSVLLLSLRAGNYCTVVSR